MVETGLKPPDLKPLLNDAYSLAERTAALAPELDCYDGFSVALVDLFSKWRNVVAHTSDRAPQLDADCRRVLSLGDFRRLAPAQRRSRRSDLASPNSGDDVTTASAIGAS